MAPVFESVPALSDTIPTDDGDFRCFRNGRQHVHVISRQEDEAPDLYIDTHTLGHYSYFFYLTRRVAAGSPI